MLTGAITSRAVARRLVLVIVTMVVAPGASAESSFWKNLWSTPHQQKMQLEQAENYEALINETDAPEWNGVGSYRSGDFAAAATSFGSSDDPSSRYNQATSLTQAGDYESALKLYDEILKENPQHEKAAQNRAITEQLQEMRQQQQQEQQGENSQDQDGQDQKKQDQQGESSEGEQQEGEQDNQQQQGEEQDSSQQDGDQENGENQEGEQQDQQSQEGGETDESEPESGSEEQPVAAETEQESEDEAEAKAASAEDAPSSMTEDQQATEQWLRRIPDDPTGLLRRKLQRSHSTDFPGVGDSASPW